MSNRLNAVTLSVAFSAFSAFAHADFNVVGEGQYVPVAYEPTDASVQQAPLSCKEARAAAWFIHELSRTDGKPDPEVAFTPCGHELLAESTADAD